MKPAPPVIRIRLPSSTPPKPTCRQVQGGAVPAAAGGDGHDLVGRPGGRLRRGVEAEAVPEPLRARTDQERLEVRIEGRKHLVDRAVEGVVAGRLPDQDDGSATRRDLELGRGPASEPAVPFVHEVDDERVPARLAGRLEAHGNADGAAGRDRVRETRPEPARSSPSNR